MNLKITQKSKFQFQGSAHCSGFNVEGNCVLFGCSGKFTITKVMNTSYTTDVKLQQTIQVLNIKTIQNSNKQQAIIISDSSSKISEFKIVDNILKKNWQLGFGVQYARALDVKQNLVAAGFSSSVIKLVDRQKHKVLSQLKSQNLSKGHTNRIFCNKFSSDDYNLLVSGGWDTAIRFWDMRTYKSVGSIIGTFINGQSIDIDSKHILVGNNRNKDKLQLFDIRTMCFQRKINFQGQGKIQCCIYDYYKKGMVLAASNQNLQIISINQQDTVLAQLKLIYQPNYLSMSKCGELALACSQGKGFLYILQLNQNIK